MKDGFICQNCLKQNTQALKISELFNLGKMTVENVRDSIDPSRVTFKDSGYTLTESIGDVKFDDNNKVLYLCNDQNEIQKDTSLFRFDQVYGVEIKEDNQTISSGGLKGAIVGDVLLGGVGAIVGSNVGKKKSIGTCAKLSVKIYLDSQTTHYKELYLMNNQKKPIKKDSSEYDKSYEIASLLEAKLKYIIRKNEGIR